MRIGLALRQFDPRRGGAEQWTTQLATQLLARGHEVHVVAERFGEQTREMSIAAHRLHGFRSRTDFAAAAQARLLSLSLDVIHDMGSGWCCDVFQPHAGSLAALQRRKLKTVAPWLRPLKSRFDRLLLRHREFRALLERQYLDDGRFLVALSQKVAVDFQRFHGVHPRRIRLIYNGVDTERFCPRLRNSYRRRIRRRLGVADDALLILIVTHNFRLKGVPMLLRAVKSLKKRKMPVHLAVVGGKRLGGWIGSARRLGIERVVSFVGSVDDTVPYYAAADLYVHPTFYDACSLVVLEALSSGLPVVTSAQNGAGELMTEGIEGYVIPDPADLGELLGRIELLFDADLRRRMGEAARRLALKHTLSRNVDQVLEVYEEAFQDQASRAVGSIRPASAYSGDITDGRRNPRLARSA